MQVRLTAFGQFPLLMRDRTVTFVHGQTIEVDSADLLGLTANMVERGVLRAATAADELLSAKEVRDLVPPPPPAQPASDESDNAS